MVVWDLSEPVKEYKSYKNEQFNKKLAKARNLVRSIDDTSLKKSDKELLKQQINQLLNNK